MGCEGEVKSWESNMSGSGSDSDNVREVLPDTYTSVDKAIDPASPSRTMKPREKPRG